jgi:hypothetical protein
LSLSLLAAACSGADDVATDDAGEDAAADASLDSGSDAAKDAGKDATLDVTPDAPKEAATDATNDVADATDGSSDASDAGSDASDASLPPSGSPCNTPNAVQQQDCGLCGFQKRGCFPDGDGGYAWGDWGFCQNQVVNGCDPKLSYPDQACGNCGTKKAVCLPNCNFDATQTCTEPPNACAPGSTEFILGASCDAGGRERTCQNNCQFGNFGACQSGPTLPTIVASATVGNTVGLVVKLPASPTLARPTISQSCPWSTTSSSTAYNYALVKNNDPTKTLKVAIYHSQAPNNSAWDTVMVLYNGSVPPADNDLTARKNCIVGTTTADGCSFSTGSPTPCASSMAGITNVTIAPLSSVVVYSSMFSTSDNGDVRLNAYTISAQ